MPENIQDKKDFAGQSVVFINFYTKFPEHTQEGTVNGMLLTANWHPEAFKLEQCKHIESKGLGN